MTAVTPGSAELLALADRCRSAAIVNPQTPEENSGLKNLLTECERVLRLAAKPVEEGAARIKVQRDNAREAQIKLLAHFYNRGNEYLEVARICDKELDRSGALLGEVRAAARAALSTTEEPKR